MKLRLEMPRVLPKIVLAIVVVFLAVTMALPALARTPLASESGNYRGQCRRLTLQINHFEGKILPLAISRGDRSWERVTSEQVERLWQRRANLCPEWGRQRTLMAMAAERIRRINQTIAMAARGAATFFSGGLSGLGGLFIPGP